MTPPHTTPSDALRAAVHAIHARGDSVPTSEEPDTIFVRMADVRRESGLTPIEVGRALAEISGWTRFRVVDGVGYNFVVVPGTSLGVPDVAPATRAEGAEGGNVFGIRGAAPPGDPVPDVVAVAERLLEEARSGRLRLLAAALVRADGSATTAWGWPGGADRTALIGAVACLGHRIVADMDGYPARPE